DVYFLRARDALLQLGLDPWVGMDVFSSRVGLCCGIRQVTQLLSDAGFDGELWALEDGDPIARGEVALQIHGRYRSFGVYETAMLGILASCSAWATAAREVVTAAGGVPVISFGARHV